MYFVNLVSLKRIKTSPNYLETDLIVLLRGVGGGGGGGVRKTKHIPQLPKPNIYNGLPIIVNKDLHLTSKRNTQELLLIVLSFLCHPHIVSCV